MRRKFGPAQLRYMTVATLASPHSTAQPHPHARPAVGVLADDVSIRRIEAALRDTYEIVARGRRRSTCLLDSERVPLEVAVLAGGGELLARGADLVELDGGVPALVGSIVIVATSEEPGLIRKALRCGVDGFVFHSAVSSALAPAMRAVQVGHLSVPKAIRRRARWSQFSVRERQVLQLVAEGLTNSEIADRLFLSESTVKCHLSSGFRKLGVSSRAEAAAAVLDPEAGLLVQAR